MTLVVPRDVDKNNNFPNYRRVNLHSLTPRERTPYGACHRIRCYIKKNCYMYVKPLLEDKSSDLVKVFFLSSQFPE